MKKNRMTKMHVTYRAALAPYSVWSVLFVLVPLIFVAYYAFTDNNFSFTTAHITRFFTATSTLVQEDGSTAEVRTYVLIFLRSLKLAVISTALCLLLGYPMAYIMARAKERTQKTLVTLIMIPMWMNFLIRTYAWMTILQDSGILNGLLGKLGLGPWHIIGTQSAVIIGMVYDYFPYMVLPIYSILAKLDGKLLEAARDLGCSSLSVLRRVIFPLSLPGVVSGIKLRDGYRQADKLDQPLFTPSTKAEQGDHDEAISYDGVVHLIGEERAAEIRDLSLKIYTTARDYAGERGIIVADTKFEFGVLDGKVILVDEVLTPDSSRFWPRDQYQVGTSPVSLDRHFVRDYLGTLDWGKTAPGPEIPDDIVEKTAGKYLEAYRMLTGKAL